MVENSGFKTVASSLSLADLMLLKRHINFTGCIKAEFGDLKGEIFVVNGEITHAEQGNERGEAVFNQIMSWPGAAFSTHAGMTSTAHTIDHHIAARILDTLRHMNHGTKTVRQGSERRTLSKVAHQLQAVDSVAYAVVHDKQGIPLQDNSIEATVLATKGLLLATIGDRIGDSTGLGEITAAVVQTQDFDLLTYYSKQHYLSIDIAPLSNLDRVEGKIRAVLVTGN